MAPLSRLGPWHKSAAIWATPVVVLASSRWQPLADAVDAFDAHFESILLRDPAKLFFDSIDPYPPSMGELTRG
jgi:hypothetical protein